MRCHAVEVHVADIIQFCAAFAIAGRVWCWQRLLRQITSVAEGCLGRQNLGPPGCESIPGAPEKIPAAAGQKGGVWQFHTSGTAAAEHGDCGHCGSL